MRPNEARGKRGETGRETEGGRRGEVVSVALREEEEKG